MQASLAGDPQAIAARTVRAARLTAFCDHSHRPEQVNTGRQNAAFEIAAQRGSQASNINVNSPLMNDDPRRHAARPSRCPD